MPWRGSHRRLRGVATLVICAAATAFAEPPRTSVQTTMRGNLAALVALQPYLASAGAFHDPKNAQAIDANLQLLSRVRHTFDTGRAAAPSASIAALFGESVDLARGELGSGRTEAARLRVRGLTTLCLGCHAQKLAPADFAVGTGLDGADLSPLERAQLFAATRRFDAALALWREALTAKAVSENEAFERALALRAAVGVAVRVKDDPSATQALLGAVWERKDLPPYVAETLLGWLKDAQAWEAEGFVAAQQTPDALYARAQKLIEISGAADSLLPNERARIPLLRATAYLNLALERQPAARWRGEALLALGIATGALADPDLWQLDGLYLEACVRENPHSVLARRCADRLAASTYLAFTGSGGTHIPSDIARRLVRTRELARELP